VKTRTSHIALCSLICLALLATFSTGSAQVPVGPTLPQEVMEAPALQDAPLRQGALEQPSQGKGFVPPPMDLSHLTGQKMPLGGVRTQAVPDSWDWRAHGKVTSVKNQGGCGACYTFAAIGNIEAKMLIDGAGTYDFSENNAKECNWYEITGTAGGTSCSGGNYDLLANMFSKKGTVLETCDPYVASDANCKSTCPYQKTLLDWRIISGNAVPDTNVLKQYIYDYGPVYTSLYAGDGDAWDTEFVNYDGSYTLYYAGTESPNHAVLIVGWDDSLSHAGSGTGGWIVKNSWGTSWGDGGYFTIAYGSASIGKYSSFMYDWQDYDSNGDIWYYDEGGWSVSTGYGDTTAWGLAVFTATVGTNVTRAEFWTTDATDDVDVYIYDDFDGNAPTNLLRQSLNHSFDEAGYHSVALASPLPVAAGDDVVVVVKFTNDSYNYPLPRDQHGPPEAGRTYTSHSGASWSASSYDVAIRLRTSAAPAPNVGVTKQVIGSDFAPGDPLTFTLTIANSGNEVAARVVVTDDMPSEVLNPTFASTLALTPTGVLSYVWNVEPLGTGDSGVITIYGQIDPGLASGFSFANMAIISDPEDNTPGNNTSSVTVGECRVYLPLVIRNYPPPPPSTLYSAGDACVLQGYPTTNFGDTSDMWAGYDDYLSPDGKIVRSLIQFDVSAIPSGISIGSATLRVYLVGSWDYPNRTRTITTYRIGSAWSESSVTWNTCPSCAEAYGSAPVTHGAWGWYSFDVTNLVRGWVNGSLPNYGVMLRGPEVSGSNSSWKGFSTREGPYTPQLAITYGGYTTSADARLADESLSRGEPACVTIEALTGRPNADFPSVSLCQPYSPAGEKCLALP